MNSKLYFKIGTIFAWKEYKWYKRLWYAIRFKRLPFNRFYVVSRRALPYIEHCTVFTPTHLSVEDRAKVRLYFAGVGTINSAEDLIESMRYVNNNVTCEDPNQWKNYKFRMRW